MNADKIQSLKELNAMRASLKQRYHVIGKSLATSAKAKAKAPFSWLKSKKKRLSASNKKGTSLTVPIVEKLAIGMVSLLLPRKMGFISKWVVGFAAKKMIKSVITKKLAPKVANKFISLRIAGNPAIINQHHAK